MGKVAKDKTLVSIGVPKKFLEEIIDKRREPLRWSRAGFILAIVQEWEARGCPPISEPDRLMQIAQETKPAKKRAS